MMIFLYATLSAYLFGWFCRAWVAGFRKELRVLVSGKKSGESNVLLRVGDSLEIHNKGETKAFAHLSLKNDKLHINFISNEPAIAEVQIPEAAAKRYVGVQEKRKGYYKFQIYNPRDPLSDSLGYVHLRTEVAFKHYRQRLQNLHRELSKLKTVKDTPKGYSSLTEARRALYDKMENIPHSYGRKEYKGVKKP